ncbi:YesL family protein [Parablautia sp. Marseille-Q6255]|uniref:YesL family protein n=1 Tax=Parablautia sp. Marseille-Q6255 TaxID=3039593 RepID=UPI0024BD4D77|nr:DUF624 domain-containing protein [Parablautia sp. Marseille-Q6255]
MRNLFNMDNPIFRGLSRLADLMILNLVFIACCIPIITIGPAVTALYYVTLKMSVNEDSYIVRSFWHSFKQNFKQAALIWLVVLAAGCLIGLDINILLQSDSTFSQIMLIIISATALVLFMIVLYTFPVLSRFENKIKTTVKNAFIMSVVDFPRTIVMMVITIGAVVLTFWNGYTLMYGIMIWILCGFAAVAYANSFFFSKIFKKYMPKDEEDDPDRWSVDDTLPEKSSSEPDSSEES